MDVVASVYRALSAGDGRAAARAVPPANATGLPCTKDRCHALAVHAANRMPLSHFVQSRSPVRGDIRLSSHTHAVPREATVESEVGGKVVFI